MKRVAAFGLRNRGSFSKQLAVINTAAGHGIPANLLEVCFIDDADDMRLYMKQIDAFSREIAAGVADAFGSSSDLVEFLSMQKALNPQTLADRLIDKALSLDGGNAKDDITAFCIRIFKR